MEEINKRQGNNPQGSKPGVTSLPNQDEGITNRLNETINKEGISLNPKDHEIPEDLESGAQIKNKASSLEPNQKGIQNKKKWLLEPPEEEPNCCFELWRKFCVGASSRLTDWWDFHYKLWINSCISGLGHLLFCLFCYCVCICPCCLTPTCRYITFRLIWLIFFALAVWRFASGDASTWGVLFSLVSAAFWALAVDLAPVPRSNNNNDAGNGERNQQVGRDLREVETQTDP